MKPLTTGATIDVPLGSLREHPENPRKISRDRLDQLKRNLVADPAMLQARPLISLPDGTVIAGNMRLRAAGELGWTRIPVHVVDLDAKTARLWMLRDNNSFGDWDNATLAEMLAELQLAGVDLDLAGFGSAELDELLAIEGPVEGEDDAPPVPTSPRSRPGDVYELGPHRLVCGDARHSSAIAAALDDAGLHHLLITDPPYGVDYGDKEDWLTGGEGRHIANDDLRGDALHELLELALTNANTHAALGAPAYVFHSEATAPIFRAAFDAAGWRYAQTLQWVKNQLVIGRQDYAWQHEPILYGWRPGSAHLWYGDTPATVVLDDVPNPRKLTKSQLVDLVEQLRQTQASDVLREPRPRASDLHPTMKPVRLLERLIRNSTVRGDLVLDVFAGAGSTLIACDKLDRRAALVELDPGYCDVIRDRWEAWIAR